MALWIILGILLILALCFLILKIGLSIEYSEKGLEIIFHAGFIRIKLHPSKDKAAKDKKDKKNKKNKKKAKTESAEAEKKGGKLSLCKEFISIFNDISEKLNKRFTIDTLTLYYMAAGEDAAQTALKFGGASIAAGVILPILHNRFTIKNKDIRTAVSFTASESYIYFKAKMSIAMRIIPYIVIVFGYRYKYTKLRKEKDDKKA